MPGSVSMMSLWRRIWWPSCPILVVVRESSTVGLRRRPNLNLNPGPGVESPQAQEEEDDEEREAGE